MLVAQCLHVGAGLFAGDPITVRRADVWVCGMAWGRRDLSIQRHRGLQRDQRRALKNVFGECFVELLGLGQQQARLDFDAGGTQFRESRAADLRIWVRHAGDNAPNPGCDDGVSAGPGSPLMAARLQVHVESGPSGFRAGLFQGQHLRVLDPVVSVKAFAYGPAVVHDHCSNTRIGRSQAYALARKFQRAAEKLLVNLAGCGHASTS